MPDTSHLSSSRFNVHFRLRGCELNDVHSDLGLGSQFVGDASKARSGGVPSHSDDVGCGARGNTASGPQRAVNIDLDRRCGYVAWSKITLCLDSRG